MLIGISSDIYDGNRKFASYIVCFYYTMRIWGFKPGVDWGNQQMKSGYVSVFLLNSAFLGTRFILSVSCSGVIGFTQFIPVAASCTASFFLDSVGLYLLWLTTLATSRFRFSLFMQV